MTTSPEVLAALDRMTAAAERLLNRADTEFESYSTYSRQWSSYGRGGRIAGHLESTFDAALGDASEIVTLLRRVRSGVQP